MGTDPVFDEEQRHLSETHQKLRDIEVQLTQKLKSLSSEASEGISNMRDELAFDFAETDHVLDTWAEYELMNKVIDAYNLANDINVEKLGRAVMLLKRPYFAKVTLQLRPDAPARDIYIGAAGMTDEKRRHFIVDWRSPVAEVYYNQENGRTSYRADGRTITCDLQLRRQFDLDGAVLHSYFDTTVAIEDPLLLASLAKGRSDKMSAITSTIQREQNQVIRHPDIPALIVNGIAGSGKTSVLLQRVAYLLYTYRDTLDARNVCLITPNPVFQRYIDHVLPEMGERNPQAVTWAELMAKMGQGQAGLDGTVTVEDLRTIDERISGLALEPEDFCDILLDGRVAVPASQVRSVARRLAHHGAGPRFCNLVDEELRYRLESKLESLSRSDAVYGEMLDLSEEEQAHIFGYRIFPQTEEEFQELATRYLAVKYAPVFDAIEQVAWLRLNRIGMRLLGKEHVSPTEWVYLKLALTGEGDRDVRYVMVDEAQDYTLAQLMMLTRYFSHAHFLLLGDENQAVRPGTATFDEMRELFGRIHGADQVDECRLTTSYRSTSEITSLFAGLLDPQARIDISSVRDGGVSPLVVALPEEAYLEQLCASIADAKTSVADHGLAAVICANRKSARALAERLGECLGDAAPLMVADDGALPASGVILLHLELAKGLEFDQVIVADADGRNYPADDLHRRRLYTAISRATQHVTVLAEGDLTPLLAATHSA